MTVFYSISFFRKRLQNLLQVKKGVYAGVDKEVHNAFANATIEEIRNNRDMILVDDAMVVVKLRMPDKKHQLARKDGYRLIYMAYKQEEKVVLLDIYPKNGPQQQLSLSDDALLELLDCFNVECAAGELVEYIL